MMLPSSSAATRWRAVAASVVIDATSPVSVVLTAYDPSSVVHRTMEPFDAPAAARAGWGGEYYGERRWSTWAREQRQLRTKSDAFGTRNYARAAHEDSSSCREGRPRGHHRAMPELRCAGAPLDPEADTGTTASLVAGVENICGAAGKDVLRRREDDAHGPRCGTRRR